MSSDALKAKIAALRAKTRAAGCTESEAMAAAELAARLMRYHGLRDEDLVVDEATASEPSGSPSWRTIVMSTIARCTNTAAMVIGHRGGTWTVSFVGRAPGPEIAVYLRAICVRAVVGAEKAFKETAPYRRRRSLRTKRQMLADFREAMAWRLASRLMELFASTMDDVARLEAKRLLEKLHGKGVRQSVPDRTFRYTDAVAAGAKAGSAVAINPGVGSGQAAAKPVVRPAPRLPSPPAQGSLF